MRDRSASGLRLQLSGSYTEADAVAAMWTHWQPRRSLQIVAAAFLVLSTVVVAISFALPPHATSALHRWTALLALFVLLVLGLIGLPLSWKRAFRRREALQHPWTFVAIDTGLTQKSPQSESFTSWTEFVKWKEGSKAFLLYRPNGAFHFIPKRFFASQGDIDAFRRILVGSVPKG